LEKCVNFNVILSQVFCDSSI